MNKQEKAALLAAAEANLAFCEKGMDDAIQEKDFSMAWHYQCKHDGAAWMMQALGLWNYDTYQTRSSAVFDRCLEALRFDSKLPQKEEARS